MPGRLGLCLVGVLPGLGWVCRACRGAKVVCPGKGVRRGRGLCPGRWDGFSPGGGAKNFFSKGPTRMYKEAVDPVWARLVDKAIFRPILW